MAAACIRKSATLRGLLLQDCSSATLRQTIPRQSIPSLSRLSFIASAFPAAPQLQSKTNPVGFSSRVKHGLRRMEGPRAEKGTPPQATGSAEAVGEAKLADVIDGKAIAAQLRKEIGEEVETLKAATGKVPGLAVVLVGSRKDSQTYVRSKKKACAEVGIRSFDADLPEDVSEEELLKIVTDFNANPDVHGILIQLPLPKHINEERVLGAVSIEKDVDGFHPVNMGTLAMQQRDPLFVACTPAGCIELLQRTGVQIAGKSAVVLGRSKTVGMPAALLLQRLNATVTVVHSKTPHPEEHTRRADIVIAAIGKAEFVKADWLKRGAVVIDVGINAVDDPSDKRGYRLVGDVDYKEAQKVVGAITPVPGGVGPMTIAVLLQNTLKSAKRTLQVTHN